MDNPPQASECSWARLRQRLAFHVMLDEFAVAALSEALVTLREGDDPAVPDLEHMVRTHRIGIMKQRAILGAAGIEV